MKDERPKYVKRVCDVCGREYAALKDQVDAGAIRHCPRSDPRKARSAPEPEKKLETA